MNLVRDASMASAWCFPDERSARTEALLSALAEDTAAAAPRVFAYEVRNVILQGLRRQRLAENDATQFLCVLGDLPIQLLDPHSYDDVLLVARQFDLSFYDAAYLELAQRLGLPLATLDARLAAAASKAGVRLYEGSQ